MADKPKVFVSIEEREQVARTIVRWLNTFPEKPITKIDYEYLNESGMTVSTIQAPYKVKSYIDGTYRAQYQAYVIYRGIPCNTNERLAMDEALNKIAIWAESNFENIEDIYAIKVEVPNPAAMSARYDDGTEDHQIQLNFIYEVKKYD